MQDISTSSVLILRRQRWLLLARLCSKFDHMKTPGQKFSVQRDTRWMTSALSLHWWHELAVSDCSSASIGWGEQCQFLLLSVLLKSKEYLFLENINDWKLSNPVGNILECLTSCQFSSSYDSLTFAFAGRMEYRDDSRKTNLTTSYQRPERSIGQLFGCLAKMW